MEKSMMVGLWHWGNDSPGTTSSEVLSINSEKPQNWVTSKDTRLTPKDKQVLAHPARPLNLVPGVRCMWHYPFPNCIQLCLLLVEEGSCFPI